MILSGCDTVVPTSYQGESRLNLKVSVLNNTSPSAELVIPVLAHVSDTRVEFRPVKYQPEFKDFRLDVFDGPSEAWRSPVDPFLAPDVIIAREYIGAVIESRLDVPIVLDPVESDPFGPACWNGSCDLLPGWMNEACAEDDQECLDRQMECPKGMCQVVPKAPVLPKGAEDVTGFAADYFLIYAPKAIEARSWAALMLGAPDGLEPGYHLSKQTEYPNDSREHFEAGQCHDAAFKAGFARYNEEHGTEYDELTLSCLQGKLVFANCDDVELPKGKAAREFAAAITGEELERGCLEMAPDYEIIGEPENVAIPVVINRTPPVWLPSVPPQLPDVIGQDEVMCADPNADEAESGRPAPGIRMVRYTGDLCPEDSLDFIESDGAFTILHGAEESGVQSCEIELVVTVPPGYRFRKPIFLMRGFAFRETEEAAASRITMTYAMSSEPMSSQHQVTGLIDGGDSFTLVDTPDVTVPECSAECEAAELDVKIDIKMDTPEGAYASFDTLEGEFEIGVEWTTCTRDFPER